MIQIYWKLHCWVGTASLKTHHLLHPSLVGSFIRKMVMADPEPVTTTKVVSFPLFSAFLYYQRLCVVLIQVCLQ